MRRLGREDFEEADGIAVDSTGAAYVTGGTDSPDFPTVNAYDGTLGLVDAFVTKLSADGSALAYLTYFGGGDFDVGLGIALDG